MSLRIQEAEPMLWPGEMLSFDYHKIHHWILPLSIFLFSFLFFHLKGVQICGFLACVYLLCYLRIVVIGFEIRFVKLS